MDATFVGWFFFAVLSVVTLAGGIMVVQSRNLFHSALWLIVSLFGVAGFYVVLSAPFLAAIQVLVYIGAIVILIIFAIMLTRRLMGLTETVNELWPFALGSAAVLFVVLSVGIYFAATGPQPLLRATPLAAVTGESLKDLGISLVDHNQYMLPFLLASVLLEAAMVGAIVVARDPE
jgi:NADH-quinone oxidoreductase subunit J